MGLLLQAFIFQFFNFINHLLLTDLVFVRLHDMLLDPHLLLL